MNNVYRLLLFKLNILVLVFDNKLDLITGDLNFNCNTKMEITIEI